MKKNIKIVSLLVVGLVTTSILQASTINGQHDTLVRDYPEGCGPCSWDTTHTMTCCIVKDLNPSPAVLQRGYIMSIGDFVRSISNSLSSIKTDVAYLVNDKTLTVSEAASMNAAITQIDRLSHSIDETIARVGARVGVGYGTTDGGIEPGYGLGHVIPPTQE